MRRNLLLRNGTRLWTQTSLLPQSALPSWLTAALFFYGQNLQKRYPLIFSLTAAADNSRLRLLQYYPITSNGQNTLVGVNFFKFDMISLAGLFFFSRFFISLFVTFLFCFYVIYTAATWCFLYFSLFLYLEIFCTQIGTYFSSILFGGSLLTFYVLFWYPSFFLSKCFLLFFNLSFFFSLILFFFLLYSFYALSQNYSSIVDQRFTTAIKSILLIAGIFFSMPHASVSSKLTLLNYKIFSSLYAQWGQLITTQDAGGELSVVPLVPSNMLMFSSAVPALIPLSTLFKVFHATSSVFSNAPFDTQAISGCPATPGTLAYSFKQSQLFQLRGLSANSLFFVNNYFQNRTYLNLLISAQATTRSIGYAQTNLRVHFKNTPNSPFADSSNYFLAGNLAARYYYTVELYPHSLQSQNSVVKPTLGGGRGKKLLHFYSATDQQLYGSTTANFLGFFQTPEQLWWATIGGCVLRSTAAISNLDDLL